MFNFRKIILIAAAGIAGIVLLCATLVAIVYFSGDSQIVLKKPGSSEPYLTIGSLPAMPVINDLCMIEGKPQIFSVNSGQNIVYYLNRNGKVAWFVDSNRHGELYALSNPPVCN